MSVICTFVHGEKLRIKVSEHSGKWWLSIENDGGGMNVQLTLADWTKLQDACRAPIIELSPLPTEYDDLERIHAERCSFPEET